MMDPKKSVDGVLLVDKKSGLTSHDVVEKFRRRAKVKKAGHTGTLDPFATGLLPIALGEGTKLATYLADTDKSYEGVILAGVRTDTLDVTGTVTSTEDVRPLTDGELERIAADFCGQQMQTPPIYSAIKRDGTPMYELARRGEAPELEPRPVRVDRLELRALGGARIAVRVDCSKGFYVRSLARDVGERLGCGATLESLRRTRVGRFDVADAIALDAPDGPAGLGPGRVIPMTEALAHLLTIEVSPAAAEDLRLGRQGPLAGLPPGSEGEKARICAGDDLVAVAASEGRRWLLERVFARPRAAEAPCPHGMIVLPPAVSQTEEEEKERSESS